MRDYKRHVKATKRWSPASVNQALAAIDNFYRSLGVGRPVVAREALAQLAPQGLTEEQQRAFLRAEGSRRAGRPTEPIRSTPLPRHT